MGPAGDQRSGEDKGTTAQGMRTPQYGGHRDSWGDWRKTQLDKLAWGMGWRSSGIWQREGSLVVLARGPQPAGLPCPTCSLARPLLLSCPPSLCWEPTLLIVFSTGQLVRTRGHKGSKQHMLCIQQFYCWQFDTEKIK